MYRPNDWENPFSKPVRDGVTWNKEVIDAFEAGADAMLKGLFSQAHQDWLATPEGEFCSGSWVFIPEEEG